ncbi:hypothetical protein E0Z10_g1608 [Xylaria hypoxylon]|uniref:Uncharacterized protein n=1 Tax=Xylaria hypoxylon TaxID=37992 RepID=A0A4Z0Z6G0_9PEZI|nr:hypothetical protein E0Z10_g1608 [Xylaria hypoxylon]
MRSKSSSKSICESKQHLCREFAGKQSRQKRKHDDEDHKDIQAKRTKTIEPDDGASNISVEDVFDLVSFSALKSICAKLLDDKTASGAKFREELLSCTQDILAHSRTEAKREKNAIITAAKTAIHELVEKAVTEAKGKADCDDWPTALYPLLPRIKALRNCGSLAGGPESAWGALIQVAASCIYEWDGGYVRTYGFGETDCDEFHDAVDKLMLSICEAQKQDGKISWLQDSRREEIWDLQEQAKDDHNKPSTYRYQKTLEFLEFLE